MSQGELGHAGLAFGLERLEFCVLVCGQDALEILVDLVAQLAGFCQVGFAQGGTVFLGLVEQRVAFVECRLADRCVQSIEIFIWQSDEERHLPQVVRHTVSR